MGRFASTVAYYESARPPYGAAFFAGVALELGLDGRQRLLDVGAGPGILAIGFARFCREVVGIDPEPGMVEAARAAGIAGRIRAGTINVNGGGWYSADAPFGGYKQSGNGREMGLAGFEEYLETKTIATAV